MSLPLQVTIVVYAPVFFFKSNLCLQTPPPISQGLTDIKWIELLSIKPTFILNLEPNLS